MTTKAQRRRGVETGLYIKLMKGQRFADRKRAEKRPGKGNRNKWKGDVDGQR